jgi:L-alanine-DL-glutamate epimerase-like enolase superfamily enzyme
MSLKLTTYPVRLALKEPFVLSYGTFHHRDTLIISLEDPMGYIGHGEATAISYFGLSIEKLQNALKAKRKVIESISFDQPEEVFHTWKYLFEDIPFLQSALDCASWDLYACRQKKTLRSIIGDQSARPKSSFTLSGTPDQINRHLQGSEWPILKVKMGTQYDDGIIEVLEAFQGNAEIRIDANGGWDLAKAEELGKRLCSIGIQWIEQPLPKDAFESFQYLPRIEGLEWWADESVTDMASLNQCIPYYHGLNFKLMKSGGITPTLQLIHYAKHKNVKVALGCMTESSFGISALAQLASLVDALDMDGNLLIQNDPGEGVYLDNGHIIFTERCGIGCQWKNNHEKI